MAVGGQAPGEVVGTVSEFHIVPAWLGEAIEAMDLTTDSVDTVSVALGKFLYGCVTPHEERGPCALREAGTPKREKEGKGHGGLRRPGRSTQGGWLACSKPPAACWCGKHTGTQA